MLCNEKLSDLFGSPSVRTVKSWRCDGLVMWVEWRHGECLQNFNGETPLVSGDLEDGYRDGRTILFGWKGNMLRVGL